MTKRIDGRLNDLENAAGGAKKWRVFWQDLEHDNLYHETSKREDAKPWTREQIDDLDHSKFQILRVNYVKDWTKPDFDDLDDSPNFSQ